MNILTMYDPTTTVLMTDFRDVFFQSNPFVTPHIKALSRSPNRFYFFNEAFPNRVVGKYQVATFHLVNCYGKDFALEITREVISTSMNALPSRSALHVVSILLFLIHVHKAHLFFRL
jgi:hypothetical protein